MKRKKKSTGAKNETKSFSQKIQILAMQMGNLDNISYLRISYCSVSLYRETTFMKKINAVIFEDDSPLYKQRKQFVKCPCGRSLNRKKTHTIYGDLKYEVRVPYQTIIEMDEEVGIYYAMCPHGKVIREPTLYQWLTFFQRISNKENLGHQFQFIAKPNQDWVIQCEACEKSTKYISDPDYIWYPWTLGDLLTTDRWTDKEIHQFYSTAPEPKALRCKCEPKVKEDVEKDTCLDEVYYCRYDCIPVPARGWPLERNLNESLFSA
jgi:hypothetical protein